MLFTLSLHSLIFYRWEKDSILRFMHWVHALLFKIIKLFCIKRDSLFIFNLFSINYGKRRLTRKIIITTKKQQHDCIAPTCTAGSNAATSTSHRRQHARRNWIYHNARNGLRSRISSRASSCWRIDGWKLSFAISSRSSPTASTPTISATTESMPNRDD